MGDMGKAALTSHDGKEEMTISQCEMDNIVYRRRDLAGS
jgi:hypothetical protein